MYVGCLRNIFNRNTSGDKEMTNLPITAQRAQEFGLIPQGTEESDSAFKERVSGELRNMGYMIEAHEAQCNRLYDDPGDGRNDPMTGIFGAMSQQLHGVNYHIEGRDQIGADIAAGYIAQNPKKEMSADLALLMVELFGRR